MINFQINFLESRQWPADYTICVLLFFFFLLILSCRWCPLISAIDQISATLTSNLRTENICDEPPSSQNLKFGESSVNGPNYKLHSPLILNYYYSDDIMS